MIILEMILYFYCFEKKSSYLQLDWTPSRNTRKFNSLTNQKGYDKSKTTVGKVFGKENLDLPGTFFYDHFLVSYLLKHVKAWPE